MDKAKMSMEMLLEWCYGDGVLRDFSQKQVSDAITVGDLKAELERTKYSLKPNDIVLLRTGADEYFDHDPHYADMGAGLVHESLFWLLDQSIRIIGTDACSLDLPVFKMVEELKSSNKQVFFPVHYATREKECCFVEKFYDLKSLPKPFGFEVALFPIKIEKTSAGWVRAVAILEG